MTDLARFLLSLWAVLVAAAVLSLPLMGVAVFLSDKFDNPIITVGVVLALIGIVSTALVVVINKILQL